MSASRGTKVFGIHIKADPKFILGGLAVLLVAALWYNLHNSGPESNAPNSNTAARSSEPTAAPVPFVREKGRRPKRGLMATGHEELRIKPVDASDGRIDPTLRTDLLARLQGVQEFEAGRSLFEAGAAPLSVAQNQFKNAPKVPVNVQPVQPTQPVNYQPPPPQVNIPLRYYGFVNPASKQEQARGLFLSGDNILVAKEGDELENRYLVVSLNATNARMEDTQMRQGQILPVAPEANEQ